LYIKIFFDVGQHVIKEGEFGDKLYIIDSGKVFVTINDQFIRELESGAMFGELALLYDSPRSASVTAIEDTVLWSLKREYFKNVQAMTASAEILQRGRWLAKAPEFNNLPPLDLSRLNNSLQNYSYSTGDFLYQYEQISKSCLLMTQGTASVYMPHLPVELTAAEIDSQLGITRPDGCRVKSVHSMNRRQLSSYMNFEEVVDSPPLSAVVNSEEDVEVGSGGDNVTGERNVDLLSASNTADLVAATLLAINTAANLVSATSCPKTITTADGVVLQKVCEISEGCIVGRGVLQSKAGIECGMWQWIAEDGAVCPFAVVAAEQIQCVGFTVDLFETLFGPCKDVLRGVRTYTKAYPPIHFLSALVVINCIIHLTFSARSGTKFSRTEIYAQRLRDP
jgi:CRP-like cAMP-binding protein